MTKGAMKAFTLEDVEMGKKVNDNKSQNVSKKDTESKAFSVSSDDDSIMEIDPNEADSELNSFLLVPQRGAARKAEQKMSGKPSKTGNDSNSELKRTKGP